MAPEGVQSSRYSLARLALPVLGSLFAIILAGCETSSSTSNNAVIGSLTGEPAQVQAKPIAFAPVIGARRKSHPR